MYVEINGLLVLLYILLLLCTQTTSFLLLLLNTSNTIMNSVAFSANLQATRMSVGNMYVFHYSNTWTGKFDKYYILSCVNCQANTHWLVIARVCQLFCLYCDYYYATIKCCSNKITFLTFASFDYVPYYVEHTMTTFCN